MTSQISKPDLSSVSKICDLEEKCALWRFRCPVQDVEDLRHTNSKYSPDFVVGGIPWRFHIQHRQEPNTKIIFLAIHLQCLTQDPRGTFGHFKITVCNVNPEKAKEKTFHCHFKKYGSAWGLHHFIELDALLHPPNGFVDHGGPNSDAMPSEFDAGAIRRSNQVTNVPCIVIDAVIRVMDPDNEGTYALGNLPQPASVARTRTIGAASALMQNASLQQPQQSQQQPPYAVLQFPYEDALCDMTITLTNDIHVAAHRCIIACRVPRLIPENMNPLPEGAVIAVDSVVDVFRCFLRFVYTEEPPERGTLRPEYLLDLYMLSMQHELYALAEHCILQVIPLLTHDNILPIIASRYSATDETLNALYLRVLASGYDRLIEEEAFETLPGTLNRRLLLILSGKEQLPQPNCPKPRTNLSTNLGLLAESGVYSDYELRLHDGTRIRCHRVVLASRSIQFNHAFYNRPNATMPALDSPDFAFSQQGWSRFLVSLYRGSSVAGKDFAAEDVALIWKLTDAISLDGRLRRESEAHINSQSAVRLLVYSEKHTVPKLRDVAMRLASSNFGSRVRADPAVWDLISELSHASLLNLFKTVISDVAQ